MDTRQSNMLLYRLTLLDLGVMSTLLTNKTSNMNLLFWRHKRNKKAIIADSCKQKLPARYHEHFEPIEIPKGKQPTFTTTATVVPHPAAGDDGFLMSMLIAEQTNSVVDGTIFGGNIFGAIIGEEIAESHHHMVDLGGGDTGGGGAQGTWDTPNQAPVYDPTPDYSAPDPTSDYSPSYDNSSSSDSSSYSSSDSSYSSSDSGSSFDSGSSGSDF